MHIQPKNAFKQLKSWIYIGILVLLICIYASAHGLTLPWNGAKKTETLSFIKPSPSPTPTVTTTPTPAITQPSISQNYPDVPDNAKKSKTELTEVYVPPTIIPEVKVPDVLPSSSLLQLPDVDVHLPVQLPL